MNQLNKIARQFVFYVALLGLWQAVVALNLWPPYLFPTPRGVFEALRTGFSDHTFWIGIGVSLKRMVSGYALSALLGIALGLVLAHNDFLEETVGRLVVSVQSMPSICWLPLAILWFGLSEKAILFVVVMGRCFPSASTWKRGSGMSPGSTPWQGAISVPAAFDSFCTSYCPPACHTWFQDSNRDGRLPGAHCLREK